jgi:hypothetical protein
MAERRRAQRVRLSGNMQARVKAFMPARILNISTSGVLLELTHPLPPKVSCNLKIACDFEEVNLQAVVRRCIVGGHGKNEKGEKIVLYHAGLAYDRMDPATLQLLQQFFCLPDPADAGTDSGVNVTLHLNPGDKR